jgi:HSP20 family protein
MKKVILPVMAASLLTLSTLQATQPQVNNPFEEIQKLQQQMDQIFNRLHQKFLQDASLSNFDNTFIKTPAADIVDKGDRYIVKTDIPGVDEKSIKVTQKDGILKIEAQSIKEKKEKSDNYIHQERFVGAFVKVLTLPKDADASKMKTEYKNGVLTITIPKYK